MWILIVLFIYLISVLLTRYVFIKWHKKNGLPLDRDDVKYALIPIVNLVITFFLSIELLSERLELNRLKKKFDDWFWSDWFK